MKKIIAFVLSLTLIITSFSAMPLYAATIRVSEEARTLATIGMLEGDGNGVTDEYMTKRMDRFTAAISILKLKGLYQKSLEYGGWDNFADVSDVKWKEGKNVLAYLKANPDLGFIGNENGEFLPYKSIGEAEYFKVLLETLGYKQSVNGKSGDFSWGETLEFAETKGLKPSYKSDFNIDLLAKATVSALKTKTKSGKLFINVLIDDEVITKSEAIYAGLIRDEIDIKVKSVKAIGNTVVEVEYENYISAYDAENTNNYSIDGLTIKNAFYIGENLVRLETSTQSSGKLYTLTAGKTKIRFTGVAKISGSPSMKTIKSEDIETVVIEFDKELDHYSATDASNYYIAGVSVDKAEIEGKKVILSTYGLESRKQYTLKVTGIKSIDGAQLRSQTKTFYSRPDLNPPTVRDVKAETNQRVVVTFSKAVTKDTAENIGNYIIDSKDGELDIYDAYLYIDEDDKIYEVELDTETQRSGLKYEITIDNIVDTTKSANVMKRAVKKTFNGMREDKTAPQLSKNDTKVLSRNHIQLAFTDNSRLDEDTLLDAGNYEIIKNDRYKEEIYVAHVDKVSYEGNKYKVMLETDDLVINSSYSMKVYNIADEFGNVLEKNNTQTISVKRDDFAASTVRDYKIIDGNEIELYFSKPLVKETAEDISNYVINNNIGYPTKAVYKDEKITLNIASMTAGKVYKLTIDGVRDKAENVLRLTIEFRATDGETDNTRPRLEYIFTENKNVVSVVFDEPVWYTSTGEYRTKLVLNQTGKDSITLFAKAYSDDGNVIEFSDIAGGKAVTGYNDMYTIDKDQSLKGITDRSLNRNWFDIRDFNGNDYVYGSNDEPYPPEVDYISQIDGKTFEVEMSKEVMISGIGLLEDNKVSAISPSATFTIDYTDEKEFVTFTITSKAIDGNKDYKIDVSKVLTDKHGIPAINRENGYTYFYGEYTDDDKPYIVDVIALDRYTVEIEYNEPISNSGTYTIKNVDDSAYYKTISNNLKKIDKNRVLLSLGNPLEGHYEYCLTIVSPAKDLVLNTSEDVKGDEFYFTGSDLAPAEVPDVDYKEAEILVAKLENAVLDLSTQEKIDNAMNHKINADREVTKVSNLSMQASLEGRISVAAAKIKTAENQLAANPVMVKIAVLPEPSVIKLTDKDQVIEARRAYDVLTEDQKLLITNYKKLQDVETKISDLEAEGSSERMDMMAASAVEEKINKLPSLQYVTLELKEDVEPIRESYDRLTRHQQDMISNKNFEKLVAIESRIKDLIEEQKRKDEDEKRREANWLAASEVINAIKSLPVFDDLRLEHKSAIDTAKEAYESLTKEQKILVTNSEKLIAAEERVKYLIEEQKRKDEEDKRKEAEESAKITALKGKVKAWETAVDELQGKVKGLTVKNEEADKALKTYMAFTVPAEIVDEGLIKANKENAEKEALALIAVAGGAVKEFEKSLETVISQTSGIDEGFANLNDREEKKLLSVEINGIKTKAENIEKAAAEEKIKLNLLRIEMAKKWLTVDVFKFSEKAKADSETPVIIPLPVHATGANYNYSEIGKMIDGKFVMDSASSNSLIRSLRYNLNYTEEAKLEFVDEQSYDAKSLSKVLRSIKVFRGKEDATLTLKVVITSENKTSYKLFNIGIPAKSTDKNTKNSPITITEVVERTVSSETKIDASSPKRFWN
ncbi:MAG: hypothetical protein GX154_10565 [Clostridiales bacterium]|nr:hypothetical protein [Clostridiales bacterium]